MKTKWLSSTEKYDGTQLRSLYAYLSHKIMGDSCVAWRGACNVSFKHMVDGEDLLEKSEIRGSDMVHFIFEIFGQTLASGVLLQRLFASIAKDVLSEMTEEKIIRSGDDLYWKKKKLSISIATQSPTSTLVHFAINVSAKGTPVPAAGLEDFKIAPKAFAEKCLKVLETEYLGVIQATQKVRWVP